MYALVQLAFTFVRLLGIGYHLTCSAVQTQMVLRKKLKTFLFQLAFN